jgi:uncharacterized protein (DUF362 family)
MNARVPEIAIVRSTYRTINKNIAKLFDLIDYRPKKKAVLLKPNLVTRCSPRSGIVTSPLFVEAVIRYLKEAFPEMSITIGEGCALHTTLKEVVKKTGYLDFKKRYGVSFVDFNDVPRIPHKWSHGKLLLPEILSTHDYINLPKMKTHLQTHVSLAMKNQKGLLAEKDKKDFHRRYDLFKSIEELSEIVKPDLNIVDGIEGLEGNGPLQHGKAKRGVNLIVASKNIIACDNVAAQLMGFKLNEIGYIPELRDYKILGEKMPWCITPFEKPVSSPMNRMNVSFYFDDTVCSICAIMVDEAFKVAFSNLPFLVKLSMAGGLSCQKHIVAGKLPACHQDHANVFCVGNCALKLAGKKDLWAISGCPPSPVEFREHYLNFCKLSNNSKSSGDHVAGLIR